LLDEMQATVFLDRDDHDKIGFLDDPVDTFGAIAATDSVLAAA
jgi:hypothetical protein